MVTITKPSSISALTDTKISTIMAAKGRMESSSELGNRLVHTVSLIGDLEDVKILLDKGANPDAADRMNITALMYASGYGKIEMCRLLIERGAEVNARDDQGRTALIWAAWLGKPETCKLLMDNGAKVETTANNGKTALKHAAERRRNEAYMLLLEKEAGDSMKFLFSYAGLDLAETGK